MKQEDGFIEGDRVFCLGGPCSGEEWVLRDAWFLGFINYLPGTWLLLGGRYKYRFGWRLPQKVVALYIP